MKKLFIRLLALVSLWLVAECISANPITETEALKRANQFMPDKHFSVRKYSPRYASSQATPPFYIFNADDGGFVLVSGDDRTTPILGYSKHGQLDLSQAPENILYWLDRYAQQIESLDHGCSAVTIGASLTDAAAISPLIQTKWSQNDPYNAQCPYGPNSDERCLTGCVATCMAQIMYYYKWPEHCPAIPAYTPNGFSQPLDELPPVDFRWDDMQLTYGRNEEGLAADAVAQLMRYCGQSVEMNYGLKVSTAALSTQIMIETFDYSENTKVIWRKNYNEADWESIIYQELAKGHPVPYSGSSIESGHQFICDGYNNGYYHINWGWGGYLDSYFVLSVANPYTDGRSGYSREQYAIIGLESRSVLSDYEVKSFTFSEDVNLNEETKVEILLTNQGNTSRERLFLWIKQEDEWSMTVAATGTVAAGQTGEVVMTFVPTTEGVFDVKLTSDPEGEVVKATATIHVVEPVEKAVGNLVYICNSASRHAIVKGAKEGASINTCVIPETFDADGVTYSVVGIANDAFNSCYDIALVTLPSTLKFIGEDAFWNCYRIKELIIPEECETIGSSAFAYCFGIEKLVLPAKSLSLGDNAFKNISNLVSVISHCNSPCSISVSVFSYSTWNEEKQNYDYEPSPATLYVPVGSKADYIAKGWDQFLKISEGEPEEIVIGDLRYQLLTTEKTAIVLPDDSYKELTEVKIPERVEYEGVACSVVGIANDAFSRCYDITFVTLPSTLMFIGKNAFYYCNNIKEINIPEECETIRSYAFAYCYRLQKLVLPAKLSSLGDNAFKNISALISVVSHCNSPCSISENVFSKSTWNEEKQNYDYEPSSATLYVPVGSKADYVAKGWDQFSKISEGEPAEIVIGELRYLLLTTEKTAIVLPDDSYKELTEVNIPDRVEYEGAACSVVGIAYGAFSYCHRFTFVTLPSTLKYISENAFYNCNNIKEINIPEECETIGSYAFAYCFRLQKLVLPAKLSSLGDNAFSDISTLVSVVSPCKSPCSISDNVFSRSKWNAEKQDYDCEPSPATLYVPVGCKTDYIAKGWDQFAAIVEDDESGIDIVIDNGRQNDDGMLYNLYGQRVTSPQTGIFIQNGKKILIR